MNKEIHYSYWNNSGATMKINSDQVHFEPASYTDQHGRVFYFEGNVYRAISYNMAPIYRELLQSKRIDHLFETGLIETEIAPLEMDGYGLILKHRKIPFISYGFEWSGPMLKDAALLTIDLSIELAEIGFELQDAHPWNVLFEDCKPKFIDFGSIIPIGSKKDWSPRNEFIKCFLYPMYLISHGFSKQSRSAMSDYTTWGVRSIDLPKEFPIKHRLKLFLLNASLNRALNADRITCLKQLREIIEGIKFEMVQTDWSDYYNEYVSLESTDDWTPKQWNVYKFISQLHPKSLLDIGSNKGWYSKLAAMNGCQVVSFDLDESCIQQLYIEASAQKLNILPLQMDFCHPSLPHGKELEFPGATQRLKCEMVLALAVVHHLVFKQNLNFDEIVKNLVEFTEKWLVVEFIPREDIYVSEWYNESFDWYTYDNFVIALRKHFKEVTPCPSNRPPRLLVFCER